MMRLVRSYIVAALILCAAVAKGQTAGRPADQLIQEALMRANKENKNVFLIFGASWCVWCRIMDSSINDPLCRDYFHKNYVILHLTVFESGANKRLENPGAEEYLNKYMATGQGIPFWMVLDKRGNVLADSNYKPGENAGCPAKPEEVAYLIAVLKRTSTIDEDMAGKVSARFLKNGN
jgi:thioredoxin-related protein